MLKKTTAFLAMVIVFSAGVYAQSRIEPVTVSLTKDRTLVIVSGKDSPPRIKIQWFRPDGSVIIDRDFNLNQGEKLIVTPLNSP